MAFKMKKVLIISKCPTHPTTAGNCSCILAQVEILRKLGCDVHFLFVHEESLWASNKQYCQIDVNLKNYWQDRLHIFNISRLEKLWFNILKVYRSRFNKKHYECDDRYPRFLHRYVNQLHHQYNFDVCIVNYYYMTKLLERIEIPQKALMTHDAFAYQELVTGEPTLCIDANTEAKAMQRSAHIFALQDDEKIYFQRLSPSSKLYTIYSDYIYHDQPIADNRNILFLSGSNAYNINGIKFFINEFLPLIVQSYAEAKLIVGGAICGKIKEYCSHPNIQLLGFIDNMDEFYAKGDVAINPVYQGTGLKIKTFEAISYGKVTLVHPHSMEGIYKKNSAPLFASEKPEEWVAFLDKIWSSKEEVEKLKCMDKNYIEAMHEFIIGEYKRFLSAVK